MKKTRFGLFSAAIILSLGFVVFLTNSCQHEGIPAEEMTQICFTEQVLPIFMNSCGTSGCHDAKTAEGDYVFTDYASIMKAITPGNASKSKAYEAITSTDEIMPPDNPLPLDKRTIIRLWIEQGAKQTDCASN